MNDKSEQLASRIKCFVSLGGISQKISISTEGLIEANSMLMERARSEIVR